MCIVRTLEKAVAALETEPLPCMVTPTGLPDGSRFWVVVTEEELRAIFDHALTAGVDGVVVTSCRGRGPYFQQFREAEEVPE